MNRVTLLLLLLLFLPGSSPSRSHAQSPAPDEKPVPTFRMQVNRVLVPVLVLDRSGAPVPGLTKDDFQVFDEGKPHDISALTLLEDRAAQSGSVIKAVETSNAGAQVQQRPQRFVVFLIDDLHVSIRDLKQVQNAASAVLSNSLDPSDYAGLLSMSTKSYTPLTRDRDKLLAGFNGVQLRQVFQHLGTECPDISYYQAVQIEHNGGSASTAFQAAMQNAAACLPNVTQDQLESVIRETVRRVLNVGDQDALTSYATIASAIQALSVLPGDRRLILLSPGFEALEQDALLAESRVIDLALQANVIINALDARGLYVSNIGAEEQGGGSVRGNASAVQQDLRTSSMSNASGPMASLAYSTGGTFFHNNNDLGSGFRSLNQVPKIEYLLEMSPVGIKEDGRYHKLEVKVRRKGVTLVARRGYAVPKAEEPKQKRKQ